MSIHMDGDVRQKAAKAENAAGALLEDAALQLRGKAEEALGRAQETFDRTKDTVLRSTAEVEAFTHERPYLALGIAALAGLAVGHLLSAGRPRVIVVREKPRL